MTIEHVVVGPPGTGKTTWISRQVARAADRFGPDQALVISLTRAAAREAAGRVDLSQRCVGTLHSHCFRSLGRPRVVDGKLIKEWNQLHPKWPISYGPRGDVDDHQEKQGDGQGTGDRELQKVERSRHLHLPIPEMTKPFAEAWGDFKQQADAIDFSDMIERAYHDIPLPPGSPDFLLVDEAQDLSPLELALLRRWSTHVEHFALVGDPNQSIYAWRFASDEMARVKPTLILGQSYRVPLRIQKFAVDLSRRSSTHLEAEYLPRDEEGEVERMLGVTYIDGESIADYVSSLEGSVMILASCGYMLNAIVKELRRQSIPYHNPYRPDNRWNPLGRGSDRRSTGVDRLIAYLGVAEKGYHDRRELKLMARMFLRTAVTRGAEEVVNTLPDDPPISLLIEAAKRVFQPEAIGPLFDGDLHWMLANTTAAVKRSLQYPVQVHDAHGMEGLLNPRVILGTIHSVKGGEADHVILIPDLSSRGMEDYSTPGWAHHDGVIRLFYVGATRARKGLHLLDPQGWDIGL